MLRPVHRQAEHDAHQRRRDRKPRRLHQQQRLHRLDRQEKPRRRNAAQARHAVGDQRRDDARHERGIIEHAHADDLQREHRRRQRRAEQGGEHRAHAAERREAHVLFIQMEQLPDLAAETAADLQRRALASRAAAEEVRDHGRKIDARHEQQRHVVAEVDRVDDRVRVLVLHPTEPVKRRDHETADRQQPQHPRIQAAQLRRPLHARVKQRADRPADRAGHARHDQPFEKRQRIFLRRADVLFQFSRELMQLFLDLMHREERSFFMCRCEPVRTLVWQSVFLGSPSGGAGAAQAVTEGAALRIVSHQTAPRHCTRFRPNRPPLGKSFFCPLIFRAAFGIITDAV